MKTHICPWWLAFTFDNPLRKRIHPTDKILSPYLAAGMTAVDIGCGMGYFSIGMARLTGPNGRVISVDLQPEMLAGIVKRAQREGVSDIIQTRRCEPDDLGIDEKIDFALAFWMAHETNNISKFFYQIKKVLGPEACLLITEPKFHVRRKNFEAELRTAHQAGFKVKERPTIAFSWAALLA